MSGGDDRRVLLTLADEALELQQEGERVMAAISDEGSLGDLSARGGPIISRFEAMRRELPACDEPLLRSAAEVLDMIFANHALALNAALDLLAVSWRSERSARGAAPPRRPRAARDLAAHDPRRAR